MSLTTHLPGVDLGTKCNGDDQRDFQCLIIPVFINAVKSCFATLYFYFDNCRTLVEVALLLPVLIICLIFVVHGSFSACHEQGRVFV